VSLRSAGSFVGYSMFACHSATTEPRRAHQGGGGRIRDNCALPGHTSTAQLSNYIEAARGQAEHRERPHRSAARRAAGPVRGGCRADLLPGLRGRDVHQWGGLPSRRRRARLARHWRVRIGDETAVAALATTTLSADMRPTRPHSSRRYKHVLRSRLTSRSWLAEGRPHPADRRPLQRRPLGDCAACKCRPAWQA
jgi:hypothetical protein